MAGRQTSFEERLARISEKRQGSESGGEGGVPPAKRDPKRARGGNGGSSGRVGMRIAMVFAIGFLGVSAVSFIVAMTSEHTFLALAERSTVAEQDGKHTLATILMADDPSGNAAIALAVRQAQQRLDSGTLSAQEEAQTRRFIENHKGKSTADIVASNMRGTLAAKARAAGQPQLADEVVAKIDACRSTSCMAMVGAEFSQKLFDITGKW